MLGAFLLLVAGAVFHLVCLEPNRLQVNRVEFELAGLGGSAQGVRLAFLSDLHLRHVGGREQAALAAVEGFDPDLVLFGGDFFTWFTPRKALARYLGSFRATAGVYTVQGNWEYKVRQTGERLQRLLAGTGVELLVNEHRVVEVRGSRLVLIGLDDPYTGHADFYASFRGLPDHLPLLMLAHSPQILGQAERWGVDLVLSGHTHGGQLLFPLIGPLWLPPGSEQTRAGRFQLGQTQLYVTSGMGTSILPARLNCPPEIVLITLRDRGLPNTAP